jgi:hypothetical protein
LLARPLAGLLVRWLGVDCLLYLLAVWLVRLASRPFGLLAKEIDCSLALKDNETRSDSCVSQGQSVENISFSHFAIAVTAVCCS